MEPVSEGDFIRWKSDPVTKQLFSLFNDYIEKAQQGIYEVDTLKPESLLKINQLKGYIRGLSEILSIQNAELITESEDDDETSS